MLINSPPALTRYDLRFTLLRIPIRVHPLFWLMAIIFGLSTGDLLHMLVWIPVVFISILVHELGHALAFRRFGQPSYVVLHAGGGMTVPQPLRWGTGWANVSLRRNQEILISLAGPGTGFLFALVILGAVLALGGSVSFSRFLYVLPMPTARLPWNSWIPNLIIWDLLWINIFWGLINLLPVFPLDGGSISRHLFSAMDPVNGVRKSLWVSMIVGAAVALLSLFFLRNLFVGLLFGYAAFTSYLLLQGRTGLVF